MSNLETNRLILRKYCEDDFDDFFEYISNIKVVEFEPYKPMDKDKALKELKRRIFDKAFIAVELKENHKLIGNIYAGLQEDNSLEVGYVFNSDYWHKGYAKEALAKIIEQAKNDNIKRVFAECDPNNENSWRLLESLNFTKEQYLKQNVYFFKDEKGNPIWKDTFVYGLNIE